MSKLKPVMAEPYYSVGHLAFLLEFHPQWVREQIRNGAFRDPDIDPDKDISVVEIGGELRVGLSALQRFLRAHVAMRPEAIRGRSRGELLRKLNRQREQDVPSSSAMRPSQ